MKCNTILVIGIQKREDHFFLPENEEIDNKFN